MPSTGTLWRVPAFSRSELPFGRVRTSTPVPGEVAVLPCCTPYLAVRLMTPVCKERGRSLRVRDLRELAWRALDQVERHLLGVGIVGNRVWPGRVLLRQPLLPLRRKLLLRGG